MSFYSLNDVTNIWTVNNNKKKEIKSDIYKFISKFCEVIDIEYIKKICQHHYYKGRILFYSINNTLSKYSIKSEIIGCVIYKIILNTYEKKRIYIQLISVHKSMRSFGYGKVIMDDFIKKHKRDGQIIELVLLALPESVKFYTKYGFNRSKSKFIERNENIHNNVILSLYM